MECLRLSRVAVSSFGIRDAFLHSPPMVESLARSWRTALFLRCRPACRTAPCATTADLFHACGRALLDRSRSRRARVDRRVRDI